MKITEPRFEELKAQHRQKRSEMAESMSLRIHRALSWLHSAELSEDDDMQFIALWISFNAAYANEISNHWETTEKIKLNEFLVEILKVDKETALAEMVWQEFPNSIRLLIANKFVYQSFWDFQNHKISKDEWELKFKKSLAAANKALGNQDTLRVLSILFQRLYTLRNQLVHGGATWQGQTNREQIKDGVRIMYKIVPTLIQIMLMNQPDLRGEPCFPVIEM